MNTICVYAAQREEVLIEYLYDDIDAATRADFDAHMVTCATCRRELEELRAVRAQLQRWAPPEPVGQPFAGRSPQTVMMAKPRWGQRLAAIPAWARAAAAVLLVGVAAGMANLDVSYTNAGLSVRTGWMTRPAADTGTTASATQVASPWRADLAALEEQLRSEMRSVPAPPVSAATIDADAVLRQVRALLRESEQRQQRELALRIIEVDRDLQARRIADLRNIENNLNTIQSSTGIDMRRLYRMTNELAVRVSQTR
jgi:anti-sigma factor RsiW